MKPRSASRICVQWVRVGFLKMENPVDEGEDVSAGRAV
jgi:hypothetical protein